MRLVNEKHDVAEPRRGGAPADEDFLRIVGERVRRWRSGRGMSRKALSQVSGVSERYLAELERGAGNASLLVVRQIADAIGVQVADLVNERPDPTVDLTMAVEHLQRLGPTELAQARRLLTEQFGPGASPSRDRIALIGLRGAGKSTVGAGLAASLGVPFIELDREIERLAMMELAEIFAEQGQAGYRRLELQALDRATAQNERVVIAAGGSIVTEPRTFDMLLSRCFVIWLKAAPETHMQRVADQGDLRPIEASRQAMDELQAILDSRRPLYAKADAQLDTEDLSPEQAVAAVRGLVASNPRP